MTIAGFFTYLILLAWGPIGLLFFGFLAMGLVIRWAAKAFLK